MTIKICICFCLSHEQNSRFLRFFRRESTLKFPPHTGHCRAWPFSPIMGLCIRQCPPQECFNSLDAFYPYFTPNSLLSESVLICLDRVLAGLGRTTRSLAACHHRGQFLPSLP